ncbi:MAG: B12-binding domain-containing radical SAM protein [Candidatus Hermodarchaeota archaeon]
MGLLVLLINPNYMKDPPVIPLGLEYLIKSLEKHGHDVRILDLCFSSSPIEDLENTLRNEKFDIVGFSIRNIDSCIYFNNEFYLPKFKKFIECIKKYKIPVVLGGSGFSAMPNEILKYLGADYGIFGPGEIAFPKFLDLWEEHKLKNKILNGRNYGVDNNLIYKRPHGLEYPNYIKNEGIVGFSTHSGCQNQCPYCIEANTKISFKKIENTIAEIEYLVKQCYSHFHLCDSEFNSDLNYCIEFCESLAKKNLPMKWTLYMKPSPYNEKLFQLLCESNAYLITLSVDSDKKIQKQNRYTYDDLAKIIDYCSKYEIELAIDLLVGYPGEPIESTKEMLDFFKKNRPKTVGISFYYRIYNSTPLAELIRNNSDLQMKLSRPYSKDENFLDPVFYNHLTQELIEDIIDNDELFRIAGVTPGVNYQL